MEDLRMIVSASPHFHDDNSVKKIMLDVLIALAPALVFSIYLFGIDAIIINTVAISSCVFFEYILQKYWLKKPNSIQDLSAIVTGLLLAFNLPSNLPIWMVIVGSFVAIAIAKMSFGGLGFNIFNPALIARVFLLISFPVQMTSWPAPLQNNWNFTDAITGATPLGIAKEAGMMGENMQQIAQQIPNNLDLFLGISGGSLGEMSFIALLIGGIFLLIRKVITWHIPVMMLLSIFTLTSIFHYIEPEKYMSPLFHILTGGAILGAFYMATDMVTSPMTGKGKIIFAIGIGIITVLIRLFGAYPEGVSFAILIMNALVPFINRYTKPKRFGEKIESKILN